MRDQTLIPVMVHVTAITGTNPGPASGITYTVDVQGPDGLRLSGLSNVSPPSQNRPPDTYDTKAAAAGSLWPGVIIAGKLTAFIAESKDDGEC